MSEECKCGDVLHIRKSTQDGYHPWVIVTEPTGNPQKVVILNMTTARKGSDKTTTLKVGDHPLITHDTVIRYSDAMLVDRDKLVEGVLCGHFDEDDPVSSEILKLIQDGLLKSASTKREIKSYCRKLWK